MGVAASAEDVRTTRREILSGDRDAAEAGANVVEWAFEEDLAAVHDADVIGYLFDLGELMAGEKDGAAVSGAVFDQQAKERVERDRGQRLQ